MSKPHSRKEENHMGVLLKNLADWHGGSYKTFAAVMKLSDGWFYKNIKVERFTPKMIEKICSAFGIPKIYFEGKYELPSKNIVTEPEAVYVFRFSELEKENKKLHEELLNVYRENSNLKTQLLEKKVNTV